MSQFQSIFSQRNSLKEQNDQLKAKYKKSLQQLMHILKVNKSLKQHLDQITSNSQQSAQQHINALKASHQHEIQSVKGQLYQCKALLAQNQEKIKQYQQRILLKQNKIQKDQNLISKLTKKVEQLQNIDVIADTKSISNGQLNRIMQQNVELKRKVVRLLQLSKEKEMIQGWNSQLKDRVKELNLQLIKQKEKSRHQIFNRQNQLLKSKEEDHFKLNTIQSKYQLLQSQLHHYKSIEKYFEEESKSIIDEEFIYNSIKEQITRINQDFNKYQQQSSYLLLKKRQQNSQRHKRMIQLEDQVNNYKQKELKYQQNNQKLQSLTLEIQNLKNQLKQYQNQNHELIKKNIVLQALNISQKHRSNSTITNQILQFQERINLLSLQQSDKAINVGLRQLIMLKEHISQLSGLLSKSKKKEEALQKRLQGKQVKMQKKQQLYKQKINQYKLKLKNYDILINKLYGLIEQKLKEKMPQEIEAEFNIALSYYQQKMLLMSDEIIKLRSNNKKQPQLSSQDHHKISIQKQNQGLKELISNLSIRMNELNENNEILGYQNQKMMNLSLIVKQKQLLVQSLSNQVQNLQKMQNSYTTQIQNNRLRIENYEKQIEEYRKELQIKQQKIRNMPKQSYSTTSLLQKINYLQFQLNKEEVNHVQNQKKLQKALKDMQIRFKHEQSKYKELQFEKNKIQNNNNHQIIQKLLNENKQLKAQLQQMESSTDKLIKNNEFKNQYEKIFKKVYDYEIKINELQRNTQENNLQSKMQIQQLNSNIISLRTANVALRNQLQNKEDIIHQLKHQAYTNQLRFRKQRSSASFSRQQVSDSTSDNNEKYLIIITLLSAEVEHLRLKKQELQVMYHEDLDKYKQALKLLQNKQLQLCNSLQYSSHKGAEDTVVKSEEQLSLRFDSASKINYIGTNLGFKTQQNIYKTYSGLKDTSEQRLSNKLIGGSSREYFSNGKTGQIIKKII